MNIKIVTMLMTVSMLTSLRSLAPNGDPSATIDDYIGRWHDAGLFHGVVLVAQKDTVNIF